MTEYNFDHVTTEADVATYKASHAVFGGLVREMRELSKKKPEATLSKQKVKVINRVLADLLTFLSSEPQGKYIELLSDEELPQFSDAVLVMVQFEAALSAYYSRYCRTLERGGNRYWITKEFVADLEEAERENNSGDTDFGNSDDGEVEIDDEDRDERD